MHFLKLWYQSVWNLNMVTRGSSASSKQICKSLNASLSHVAVWAFLLRPWGINHCISNIPYIVNWTKQNINLVQLAKIISYGNLHRLAAVLGLESLGIGLLVHLLPLVVLLEAEPRSADPRSSYRHGGILVSFCTSWPQSCWAPSPVLVPSSWHLSLVLLQTSWCWILDNFLKGEQLKKMAMVTILPVVHYALVPHRGVHSTLEGPNWTDLDFSRQLWPHFCRMEQHSLISCRFGL